MARALRQGAAASGPTARRAIRSSTTGRPAGGREWPGRERRRGRPRRATSATPARPTAVPSQTRAVHGSPPGRRPSRSRIHRGTVATMRARSRSAPSARPHDERVPDGEEEHADERVVEPLRRLGQPFPAVHDERDETHDRTRAEEAPCPRRQRRYLAHDHAHGEGSRAPHDPHDDEGDPGRRRRGEWRRSREAQSVILTSFGRVGRRRIHRVGGPLVARPEPPRRCERVVYRTSRVISAEWASWGSPVSRQVRSRRAGSSATLPAKASFPST